MDYRTKIAQLKSLYLNKEIDYDELRKLASPIVDEINKKGIEIAKRFGQRYKKLSLSYILR